MFQNVQDVLAARLAILVENEKLEAGEANIAVRAINVLVENSDPDELATALEDAMWMDNTVREVGPPPVRRQSRIPHTHQGKRVREGIDNDGLTEDEVNASMDEQHACSENCPPA